MKQGKCRIAAVSMNSITGDIEGNLNQIEQYCEEAYEKEIDVLCFPELAVTGQKTECLGMKLFELAGTLTGPETARLSQIAQCTQMYLVIGLLQKSMVPGRLFSTQVLISPVGKIELAHQKNELEGMEQLFLKSSIRKESKIYDFPSFKGGFLMGQENVRDDMLENFAGEKKKVLFVSSAGKKDRENVLAELAKTSNAYVVEADNYKAYIISPEGKILKSGNAGAMIEENIG